MFWQRQQNFVETWHLTMLFCRNKSMHWNKPFLLTMKMLIKKWHWEKKKQAIDYQLNSLIGSKESNEESLKTKLRLSENDVDFLILQKIEFGNELQRKRSIESSIGDFPEFYCPNERRKVVSSNGKWDNVAQSHLVSHIIN